MADASDFDLLLAYATKFRAAGVTSMCIGPYSMTLLPAEPEPAPFVEEAPESEPKSLLEDPSSYGLGEGETVPGFIRPIDLSKG